MQVSRHLLVEIYWIIGGKKDSSEKGNICVMIEELRKQKMETEEERKRGRKVKKSR